MSKVFKEFDVSFAGSVEIVLEGQSSFVTSNLKIIATDEQSIIDCLDDLGLEAGSVNHICESKDRVLLCDGKSISYVTFGDFTEKPNA